LRFARAASTSAGSMPPSTGSISARRRA
jgi:hypothetical protein